MTQLHIGLLRHCGISWTYFTSHNNWKFWVDAETPRHLFHLAIRPAPEMGANTLKRAVDHSEVGSNVDCRSDDHGWSPVRDSQWGDIGGHAARIYSQLILACGFAVSYDDPLIGLTGWLNSGKGLPPRMSPYHLVKPQSSALGFFIASATTRVYMLLLASSLHTTCSVWPCG